MKSVYLLSDFNEHDDFKEKLIKDMKRDLISYDSIVFICSSPNEYQKSDYYFNSSIKWLESGGIKFNDYCLLDNRINKIEANRYIKNSSCIVLMGGITRDQMVYLRECDLIESLQNHNGVIIGISAGAINLAVNSLCLEEPKNADSIRYVGLGLTDKTIYPHFSIDDHEIVNELTRYTKDSVIYGICECSAIIERENETIFIGEVYEISNNKIVKGIINEKIDNGSI